jgi:hypothetical protein
MRVVAWLIDPRLIPSLARAELWQAATTERASVGQPCLYEDSVGAVRPRTLESRP